MVDESGELGPKQNGQLGVNPAPIVIRKGLDVDKIMANMSEIFSTWTYQHGLYY